MFNIKDLLTIRPYGFWGIAGLCGGAALTVAGLAGLAAAANDARDPWPEDLAITLTALDDGDWRLDYDLAFPAHSLDLGDALGDLRPRAWRVASHGMRLIEKDGADYLVADGDGATFSHASLIVAPEAHGLKKDYEAISTFADGGVILYTGHFQPYKEHGGRYDAVFNIIPRKGEHVSALGEAGPAFKGWTSPLHHPAFIYAGPQYAAESELVRAVIDPSAPAWVRKDAAVLGPRLAQFFAQSFGRAPRFAPDMFLAMGDTSEPGRIRYSGDALPGQFLITLSGGAWGAKSPEAEGLLKIATAHEAAHLWQTPARPRTDDVPDWIHEGAADAIAVEALAAIGEVSPGVLTDSLDGARRECAGTLAGGSLLDAERGGVWRASYACGHVLAVVAARAYAPNGTVIGFWRDFVARAEAGGGYDETLFGEMIAQGGDEALAADVVRFPKTAYAAPEKELASLLERALNAGAAVDRASR